MGIKSTSGLFVVRLLIAVEALQWKHTLPAGTSSEQPDPFIKIWQNLFTDPIIRAYSKFLSIPRTISSKQAARMSRVLCKRESGKVAGNCDAGGEEVKIRSTKGERSECGVDR